MPADMPPPMTGVIMDAIHNAKATVPAPSVPSRRATTIPLNRLASKIEAPETALSPEFLANLLVNIFAYIGALTSTSIKQITACCIVSSDSTAVYYSCKLPVI
jgi:hypothetical protein